MSVKARVLALLSEEGGSFLGGEQMAERLGCSRAAIWKAVLALKEEGHEIEASRAQGYRLVSLHSLPTPEGIRLWLPDPEVPVKVYESLPSTNQTAKAAFVAGEAGEGAIFVALEQSAGRGRLGREFYSPAGAGVYFSLILKPRVGLEKAYLLTTAAAVAVYRAVRELCGISLSIKWVNDLYLNGKKVAGILTEAVTDFESGSVQAAIVGIGINLYPPEGGYPPELREKAGPLFATREAGLDQGRLIATIVRELLLLSREERIQEDYVRQNLVPGHRVVLLGEEEKEEGLALGITEEGGLRVRLDSGEEKVLRHGEVQVLFGEEKREKKRESEREKEKEEADAHKKTVL